MQRGFLTALVAACLLLAVAARDVVAQPTPSPASPPAGNEGASGAAGVGTAATLGAGGRGGGSRGPMLVVLRIAEALQLNDEQTVKLASEFRRVAQQRRTLLAEKAALQGKLEAQLSRKPLDEASVSDLTDRLVALDRDLAQLPGELWKSIQPVLTVEQRARLVLLRDKMKKQVDGERLRRRGRGRGGGDSTD